jgi:hypothetical protein
VRRRRGRFGAAPGSGRWPSLVRSRRFVRGLARTAERRLIRGGGGCSRSSLAPLAVTERGRGRSPAPGIKTFRCRQRWLRTAGPPESSSPATPTGTRTGSGGGRGVANGAPVAHEGVTQGAGAQSDGIDDGPLLAGLWKSSMRVICSATRASQRPSRLAASLDRAARDWAFRRQPGRDRGQVHELRRRRHVAQVDRGPRWAGGATGGRRELREVPCMAAMFERARWPGTVAAEEGLARRAARGSLAGRRSALRPRRRRRRPARPAGWVPGSLPVHARGRSGPSVRRSRLRA